MAPTALNTTTMTSDEIQIQQLKKGAKNGDALAQLHLGFKYYNGEGVTLDYKEALHWYRLAADQGDARSQYNLGFMYEKGLGVAQDYDEAAKWYRLAADQGDAAAQYMLGEMYEKAEGVTQDYNEAIKWYRLAADQGNADAQYNLGDYHLKAEDLIEAIKWYRLAAAQKGGFLCEFLGRLYYDGEEGIVPQDFHEAAKWYRLGAERGMSSCGVTLGYMYEKGYGVTQDYDEAIKRYRWAATPENYWQPDYDDRESDAEPGSFFAQYRLGYMYEEGLGVTQDYVEAVKWFRLAANQGHEESEKKLLEIEKIIQQANRPSAKLPSQNKPSHLDAQNSDARLNEILDELNKLIGLEQVKKEIYQLIQFVRVQQMRSKEGLYSDDYHLNCIFLGSPGTGKTTVANIYAEMLHSMGVLSKGHLVKTSRQGLVAGDIRQTELKTDAKIDEALGGILFIGQAHALLKADDSSWDYGQDVINILLRRMEDHQNDFAVILAGYPESMDNFIEAKEGLRSQFPTIVHFEDYSPDELLSMLNLFCLKANYEIEPKAIEKLGIIVAEAYEIGDMNLRNARFVRTLFEGLRKWQSVRIGETVDNPTIEDLKRITTTDVELLKTNR